MTVPPALAHSVDGTGATNYLARLRSVEPRVDGLDLLLATAAVAAIERWGGSRRAALVLVVAGVAHILGTAAFAADAFAEAPGHTIGGSVVSVVGWIAGAAAVFLLARRRSEGLFAAGVAGVAVAVNGGLADLSDLSRSQLPFGWREVVARGAVAVAIGVGLGLVIAAFVGVQRHPVPMLSSQAKPGGGS